MEDKCYILGEECRKFRKSINETQRTVSLETGYSVQTISGFENGRNNNMIILAWYIKKGMRISDDMAVAIFDLI